MTHAEANKELAKYWKQVEEVNENARNETKKIEKERKKLEMGSDYESEPEEFEDDEEEEDENGGAGEAEEGSQLLTVSLHNRIHSLMRRRPTIPDKWLKSPKRPKKKKK